MAQIDLGRVVGDTGTSLRYRGDWTAATEYRNDAVYIDLVAHDDCLWICKATNTGQEPARESDYWDLAAQGTGVYASDSTADPPISLILDADTLGGQGPEYYAKQADLEAAKSATVRDGVQVLYNKFSASIIFNSATISADAEGWVDIGSVPEACKPSVQLYGTCYDNNAAAYEDNGVIDIWVSASGTVRVYMWGNHLTCSPRGTVTYSI